MSSRKEPTFFAIGGGNTEGAVRDEIFKMLADVPDATVTVMTVATEQTEGLQSDYNSIFRKKNVGHVYLVDVSVREDAFREASLKKIEQADLVYFTGGDQLNITTLFGGSPLHDLLYRRTKEGLMIAGTSAGAAMMSESMLISGEGDAAPRVGGVEIGPGLNLIPGTVIDTHFSQRGRYGRLLTAIAHHPQNVGLGIDESTAIKVTGDVFEVVGEGSVTVVDASGMHYNDLVYRDRGDTVTMFDVALHVLTAGYRYSIKDRRPLPNASHAGA